MTPSCTCHDEPMKHRSDRPGHWRCAVRQRATNRAVMSRYFSTPKGRANRLRASLKMTNARVDRRQEEHSSRSTTRRLKPISLGTPSGAKSSTG